MAAAPTLPQPSHPEPAEPEEEPRLRDLRAALARRAEHAFRQEQRATVLRRLPVGHRGL